MATRTGSDRLYGVRYDSLGSPCHPTAMVRDADLGALDAPELIAAGSHVHAGMFGVCVLAAFRSDGDRFAVTLRELAN
jgi:hypothetical protein